MDKIYHYMSEQLLTIEHDASVFEAAIKIRDKDVQSLVITNEDNYVGIITDVDITRKAVAEKLDPSLTNVSAIMEKPLITLDRNLPMEMALLEMRKNDIRHIVVTDNGQVTGIVSIKDFANYHGQKVKDPISTFWSNYESLLDESAFNYAIEKLLKEIANQLGDSSKTGQAIRDHETLSVIAKTAGDEGLIDLAQILRLPN